MTCSLHRASAAELQGLREEPDRLGVFLGFDDPIPPVRAVRPGGLLGFLLRLSPITISEVSPEPVEQAGAPSGRRASAMIDIDKGWHGLHYLLTGSADEGEQPASFLLNGGASLDDDGFARAVGPAETRRVADFLAGLSPDELEGRYDPVRMRRLEVYPEAIWEGSPPGEDPPVLWLLDCFREVRDFMLAAAAAGDGVVIHIS